MGMKQNEIYLGQSQLKSADVKVEGGFENINGEQFYKISNYNLMPDFFMSIVSDSDHWMFLSSNGSLTAGRKDRDNALFPYYSDDKIHDYNDLTGSKTIALVEKENRTYLWEPFSVAYQSVYSIERNLYKSKYGNKIIFEEINNDLGVRFRYGWYNSDKYGIVKKSEVVNVSDKAVKVKVLDGMRNILPYGFGYIFQIEQSNLLDAYKKNELQKDTNLGIFSLSSIPVDRAEPSESLKATTVWSSGQKDAKILLSDNQLAKFKNGLDVTTEVDVRAARGAYYLVTDLTLDAKASEEWMLVAEINQDSKAVNNLNAKLKNDLTSEVNKDIEFGTDNLIKIIASADGLQESDVELNSARHFSNTMYNVMRGGIYMDNYNIDSKDFISFVNSINTQVAKEQSALLAKLPEKLTNAELLHLAEESKSLDFVRICYEYLPLTFSRRHGDPSRPWNKFSIDTKNEDGSPRSDFQGNWRDIFQNWEALSLSYPEFIENIISKFVNASTADGYNPYRIMRNGIDWECPDPDDPWAYIGYWGDHQIIYLQKLLELSKQYHPGKLDELLTKDIFAYANVPYRIKSYTDIAKNPQDTIEFDADSNNKITQLVKELGADGRLILNQGKVYQVNLTEKILATLLSKLSNFIPEAGIWLNTQRPEWNDANNALVGNGVSMVTLYYLRRFLKFWNDLFTQSHLTDIEVSEELVELFEAINKVFASNKSLLDKGFTDADRKTFADELGEAGTIFRNKIYDNSFTSAKKTLSAKDLAAFTELSLEYMDQSIRANKREDGLYHAYNLISFTNNGVSVRYLYEMLEGQVAVLSSGYLSTDESISVFDALKASALFREDQYSYILYPDRNLPRFMDKNNIPDSAVESSKLLKALVDNGDTSVVSSDELGGYHFNGTVRNADCLQDALNALDTEKYGELVKSEGSKLLAIHEEMFDHQSFTGRSGTFYGYEGLGSIYWHMVSKLLLAAQEAFFKAVDEKADAAKVGKLVDHYYEIKAGIGLFKSPDLYGAFPTDAYSHTPGNAGAKQPGMTGQVKEDVIARFGELGVRIQNGEIVFEPVLLNKEEKLSSAKTFDYIGVLGNKESIALKENQLAFTICQVPVVYTINGTSGITVTLKGREKKSLSGNTLEKALCDSIFQRLNTIELIEVSL